MSKLKSAFNKIEEHKQKVLQNAKNEFINEESDKLKQLVAEGFEANDEFDDMEAESDTDFDNLPEGDEMGMEDDGSMDELDADLKRLKEELGISEDDDEMEMDSEDLENADSELDMEDDFSELDALGEMEENSEEDDVEAQIDRIVKDLESQQGSSDDDGMQEETYQMESEMEMEDGDEYEDEELKRMQAEADRIMEEIEGEIEGELKKEYGEDDEELEENMSVSYTNGKGMNKKPESFKDDYDYLTRENKKLKKDLVESLKKQKALYAKATQISEGSEKLALINDSLIRMTHIFMENALTKAEKHSIVETFLNADFKTKQDTVNLAESVVKKLKEAKTAKKGTPLTESSKGTAKIANPKTEDKKEVIQESTSYEDEAIARMKKLMSYKNK